MTIETSVKNGVRLIRLNNPKALNSMTTDMYRQVTNILNQDADNDKVVVTIITGKGEYFTSGNSLSGAFKDMGTRSIEDIFKESDETFEKFVDSFLAYPKLLILVVNGPAIGIGVTLCGLCDVVYASDTATFQTPFVKLSLCIEGCGSYLLPRILGKSKATELLLLGHKITADEALKFNLVSKIVPVGEIEAFIEGLYKFGRLPVKSVVLNKKLMNDNLKERLWDCKVRECRKLAEVVRSDEFAEAVMEFIHRKKSKL